MSNLIRVNYSSLPLSGNAFSEYHCGTEKHEGKGVPARFLSTLVTIDPFEVVQFWPECKECRELKMAQI